MFRKLECPIMATIAMISDKWKVLIICKLKNKTLRFNELRRELKGVTQRVLTHQLRELEADGLVNRQIYAEVPPRVEYSLTELGQTLIPVLDHLESWAQEHSDALLTTRGVIRNTFGKCVEIDLDAEEITREERAEAVVGV